MSMTEAEALAVLKLMGLEMCAQGDFFWALDPHKAFKILRDNGWFIYYVSRGSSPVDFLNKILSTPVDNSKEK